jgi:hypothetical protein
MTATTFAPAPPAVQPCLRVALRLDHADLFGTLEWVLATARRTGLTLDHLHLPDGQPGGTPRWLHLAATASEADRLDLFMRRVENGVDVLEVVTLDGGKSGQPGLAAGLSAALSVDYAAPGSAATGSNSMPSSAAAQVSRTIETKSRTYGLPSMADGTVA